MTTLPEGQPQERPTGAGAGHEAWLLISGEEEAIKLFVTWPIAHKDWDGEDFEELVDRWAEVSGVEEQRVRHFVPILFENELLLWDGRQATRILDLIRAQIVQGIRRTGR